MRFLEQSVIWEVLAKKILILQYYSFELSIHYFKSAQKKI